MGKNQMKKSHFLEQNEKTRLIPSWECLKDQEQERETGRKKEFFCGITTTDYSLKLKLPN